MNKRKFLVVVFCLVLSLSAVVGADETEFELFEEELISEVVEDGEEPLEKEVNIEDTSIGETLIVDETLDEGYEVETEAMSEVAVIPSEELDQVDDQIALFSDDDDDDEDESEDESEEQHEPQEIKAVTIRVDERAMSHQVPAYDTVVQSGNVFIEYEKWTCVETGYVNGSFASAVGDDEDEFDVFEEGKTYSYSIRIIAKDGDWFTDSTVFKLGNRVVTNGVFNKKKTAWTATNVFTEVASCYHDYERITEPATCTNMGLVYDRCKYCRNTTIIRSIPALGHSYEEIEDNFVEPTCTTSGQRYYVCETCNNVKITPLPATGHRYELDEDKSKEPTCTSPGYFRFVCENEGCKSYYDTARAALGHRYVLDREDSIDPTCTSNGYYLYSCKNDDCDSFYTTVRPALGHVWGVVVTKRATATKIGTYHLACVREECEASQNNQSIFPYKKIILSASKFKYTGSAIRPALRVVDTRGATIDPSNYVVVMYSNKNVGTAKVHVTFSGKYSGTLETTFKIVQASQSISVPATSYTLKKSDLKKASKTINLGASAKTSLSYSESSSHLSISGGKVKVKKGTPKGTYKIKIKAKETKSYKSASKTIKIVVK